MSSIKDDFPIFANLKDKSFIYFDNAATTQKPLLVINSLNDYYTKTNSNVHRGVYSIAEIATSNYESSREKVQKFINAKKSNSIIFTKGATESINLVANAWGLENLSPGDEVLITEMEHHSNIVPWQILCKTTGAILKYIPINNGQLELENLDIYITKKTKFVSIIHQSNVFGTINDIEKIIEISHKVGAKVLIDGSQIITHIKIDVQKLDCDFYVFSGHKTYGPSGIGVLYGKEEILNSLPPYQGGGGMINEVTLDNVSFADLPAKYEAGTPPLVEAYGLGIAIDYMNSIGIENIMRHEQELSNYALDKMGEIEFVEIYGKGKDKTSIISFNLNNIHPHEVASFLDVEGIAVRAGHHCCQPLMKHLNISATSRISFGVYNSLQEIDVFIDALKKCKDFFKK